MCGTRGFVGAWLAALVAVVGWAVPAAATSEAAAAGAPPYGQERGGGIPTSLLGTYIRRHELLIYPFYEYTRSRNFEYDPQELGYGVEQEFFGRAVEREALLFIGYAFSDALAFEFESALYSSIDFTKAADDTSAVPAHIRESGLGDTEMQVRWRGWRETDTRPEVTLFFKTVFPLQKDKKLLGTQDWEFSPGIVLTKAYSFGTLSLRLSLAYDGGEKKLEFSEYAIDYLKQLTPNWRLALSLEGEQDEVEVIGELQYKLGKNAELKLNSGFGVSKKAPQFAPEIGVMFRF